MIKKKSKKLINMQLVLVLIFAVLVLAFLYYSNKTSPETLAEEAIKNCTPPTNCWASHSCAGDPMDCPQSTYFKQECRDCYYNAVSNLLDDNKIHAASSVCDKAFYFRGILEYLGMGYTYPAEDCHELIVAKIMEEENTNKILQTCKSIKNNDLENTCYMNLSKEIAKSDPEKAISICKKFKPYIFEDYNTEEWCLNEVSEIIIEYDIETAEEMCEDISDKETINWCYWDIYRAYLDKNNTNAALNICEKITDEPYETDKAQCYTKVAGKIVISNKEDAIEVCNKIQGDYEKFKCYFAISDQLIKEDPEVMINLCNNFDDLEWKNSCYADLVTKLGTDNLELSEYICSITTDIPDGYSYKYACYCNIARVFAESDINMTLKYFSQIANIDSPLSYGCYSDLIKLAYNNWGVNYSLAICDTFLDTNKKDNCYHTTAIKINRSDVKTIREICNKISDETISEVCHIILEE